jgi:hypothetical protein
MSYSLIITLITTTFLIIHDALSSCVSCEFAGPSSRSNRTSWFQEIQGRRSETLNEIGYAKGVFEDLKWTQSSYIQPQMHPYDRYFYSNGSYTVDRFLDDLKARYGGIDAMLFWPTYTNIGIDDRNQFDYFRAMPGGLEALKILFHTLQSKYNVRVLLPYNPWDTGTRREPYNDSVTMAMIQEQVGAVCLSLSLCLCVCVCLYFSFSHAQQLQLHTHTHTYIHTGWIQW